MADEPITSPQPIEQPVTPAQAAAPPVPDDPYDLGETGFDDLPEPDVAAAPEPPAELPPRDPATGQFVPRQERYQHTGTLRRLAEQAGFEAHEIQATAPDQLWDRVHTAMRAREVELSRSRRVETISNARVPEPPPAPPPAAEDDFDLPENDFDPRLVKLARGVKQLREENRRLREEMGGLGQREQAREGVALIRRLDRWFSKNPEQYGQGSGAALAGRPDSPEAAAFLRKRNRVIAAALADRSPAEIEEKLDAIHADFHPATPYPQAAPAPGPAPRVTPQQWDAAGLVRPTQRAGAAEPKGDQRAMKAVAQFQRDNGVADPDMDQFPD